MSGAPPLRHCAVRWHREGWARSFVRHYKYWLTSNCFLTVPYALGMGESACKQGLPPVPRTGVFCMLRQLLPLRLGWHSPPHCVFLTAPFLCRLHPPDFPGLLLPL